MSASYDCDPDFHLENKDLGRRGTLQNIGRMCMQDIRCLFMTSSATSSRARPRLNLRNLLTWFIYCVKVNQQLFQKDGKITPAGLSWKVTQSDRTEVIN